MKKTFNTILNLLKSSGIAEFDLSEQLFDQDFPGHYCRMIKSIAISIDADVDPSTEIHATLTQLKNEVRLEPKGDVRTNWCAKQQIAISKAVKDDGMFGNFDLNFIFDDRYFPFEGTGAVSSWKLEIPPDNNPDLLGPNKQLKIKDVIIHLKYTAKVGGEKR